MVAGQDVLSHPFDVAALNRVEARLESREAARAQLHAQTLRTVLELHRIFRAAGLGLNTVPQVALVLGCAEHRAHELFGDAQMRAPLPGALEAVECGLLGVEQIRRHASPMGPDDTRSADQRRLDAALDLLCGRTALPFDQGHCQPGCDCRPGQGAPCGADVTVLVPLGAALGTTDEPAELVGHGRSNPTCCWTCCSPPRCCARCSSTPTASPSPAATWCCARTATTRKRCARRCCAWRTPRPGVAAPAPRRPPTRTRPARGRPAGRSRWRSPPAGPPPSPFSSLLGPVPVRVADRAAACADPTAHQLRAEDLEPDNGDPFPADTRRTLDLDDPSTSTTPTTGTTCPSQPPAERHVAAARRGAHPTRTSTTCH